MKAAAETLITIAADPKHLGAKIGFTAALHSWAAAMTHHPHLHMIVPGGGIARASGAEGASPTGTENNERWISCRPRFFLHVLVLSRLFRRLFLAKLCAAHHARRLCFFTDLAYLAEREAFSRYLAPWHDTDWVVYAKPPAAGPQAVLAYLSRYTHRVAISNSRLITLDDNGVTFTWKDYRAKGPWGPLPAENHDADDGPVHSPLPEPRPAAQMPNGASTASVIMACSPTAIAPRPSPERAGCSPCRRLRPAMTRPSTRPTKHRPAPIRAQLAAAPW